MFSDLYLYYVDILYSLKEMSIGKCVCTCKLTCTPCIARRCRPFFTFMAPNISVSQYWLAGTLLEVPQLMANMCLTKPRASCNSFSPTLTFPSHPAGPPLFRDLRSPVAGAGHRLSRRRRGVDGPQPVSRRWVASGDGDGSAVRLGWRLVM